MVKKIYGDKVYVEVDSFDEEVERTLPVFKKLGICVLHKIDERIYEILGEDKIAVMNFKGHLEFYTHEEYQKLKDTNTIRVLSIFAI